MIQALIPLLMLFGIATIFKTIVFNAGQKRNTWIEEEIERDRVANFARRKDIPENLFYVPDLENLPIKDYPNNDDTFYSVITSQKKVTEKVNLKMLKLSPPLSNVEIKERFGYANLEDIIDYEENYYEYIHALNNFAVSLIKINDIESAEKVLLSSILEMESNIIKTYSLLFKIYLDTNEKNKLTEIYEHIISSPSLEHEDDLKSKIKNQYNNII